MCTIKVVLYLTIVSVSWTSTVQCNVEMDGYGNNRYAHFTSYFWTHPKRQVTKNGLMTLKMGDRTCQAVQLNFIARHGWRYASAEHFQQYATIHKKILKNMKSNAYSFIRTWKHSYNEEMDFQLGELGRKEMEYLGQKFRISLHDLTSKELAESKYSASNTTRALDSANSFMDGSLGVIPNVIIDDSILRPYLGCAFHNSDIRKIAAKTEQHKFEMKPEFETVVRRVQEKLHLESGTLDAVDIKRIWELCAQEMASRNNSDWCTLLTDDDRDVLQYGQDIADFRLRFRGHPFNKYMGCPLMKDILLSMEEAVQSYSNNKSYNAIDARFGHYPSVTSLYSNLGLYKDKEPLLANNYHAMKNRLFDSSRIVPMSANIAFILYNCGDSAEDYLLKLYVNEEDVKIPLCKSNPCRYSEFKGAIQSLLDNCNLPERCNMDTNASSPIILSYVLVVFIGLFNWLLSRGCQ